MLFRSTFPAVPYHAGLLRVQVNANHLDESIDGLLDTFDALKRVIPLPGPKELTRVCQEIGSEAARQVVATVA